MRVTSSIIGRIVAVFFMASAIALPVHADEAQEVGKLIKNGQLDQAANKADAFLATKPNDAQMRFFKGLILTRQGRTTEALALFVKLTEDFPELSEPYNNIAVLYAAQGQYDKARVALEMSLRTRPDDAITYENLGDVYVRLADQAYEKSATAGNGAAQGKRTVLHEFNNRLNTESTKKSAGSDADANVKK